MIRRPTCVTLTETPGPYTRFFRSLCPVRVRGGAERPRPNEQTTCRPAQAPCPRDPRTRSRPPCGSSPNGQARVRAWGAQRLEPRCRASDRRTMVVIVAQLSYIEHGSQAVLMAATAFVRSRIDET